MKIVADDNIPGIREWCTSLGDIELVDGRQLRRRQLRAAEVLLVRSVTPVNAALLAGTPVRFVVVVWLPTGVVPVVCPPPRPDPLSTTWSNTIPSTTAMPMSAAPRAALRMTRSVVPRPRACAMELIGISDRRDGPRTGHDADRRGSGEGASQ